MKFTKSQEKGGRASAKQKTSGDVFSLGQICGRDDRARTCDLLVPNQALYLLSYVPKSFPTISKTLGMSKGFCSISMGIAEWGQVAIHQRAHTAA